MKVICEAYKCEFSSGKTCVMNQQRLKKMKANRRKCKQGLWEILTKPVPAFYGIEKCNGCEIGIRLYNEAKKNGTLPVEMKRKRRIQMSESERNIKEYKAHTAQRGW